MKPTTELNFQQIFQMGFLAFGQTEGSWLDDIIIMNILSDQTIGTSISCASRKKKSIFLLKWS